MNNIYKQTAQYYNIFLSLTIVFGIFASVFRPVSIGGELSISLESLMIILNFSMIPFSLKYFSKNLKSIQQKNETKDSLIKEYRKLYIVRLLMLGVVIILNFLLFSMLRKSSCLIFSGLIYLTSMFCFPSKSRIKGRQNHSDPLRHGLYKISRWYQATRFQQQILYAARWSHHGTDILL